jgi:hypothetical protein
MFSQQQYIEGIASPDESSGAVENVVQGTKRRTMMGRLGLNVQ